MEFTGKLIKGVSQKTGNPYMAIDVQITPTYSKRVFLTGAEQALVETRLPSVNTK